jgi:hypothetical protein
MYSVAPAKVTPPWYEGAIERSRLLARLDSTRESAVVWFEAPPGAGKTTLVASYLATREVPCLWYRIDATDHDVGSFFHHLTLAASVVCGGAETGLPRFGPEYAAGGEAFTRNYFRQLFECIPCQLIVFDEYQELGADSPLHRMIAIGMDELPAGYRALVLSRSPPPMEYARLQSTRSFELLDPFSFLLTEDETTALCNAFGEAHGVQLSSEACAALHSRCGGWVTGLVLMLEARRTRGFPLERTDAAVPAVVFDYFASEILSRTDSDTERVLLGTAMLEEITPELAVSLSGVGDADRRLDTLSRRGYFTVRHEGRKPSWTYHQLFRQFLRRRAAEQLGDEGWSALQSRAAGELAACGDVEQAIELHRRLGNWRDLVPLLSKHAPLLLAQGRHGRLLRWIDEAPVELRERSPWLLYWFAMARRLGDPGLAKEGFEKAFQGFLADGDIRGTYLAWAMSVQNIFYEQSDYRLFDKKIEELEPLLERFDLPDETVEAVVFTSLAQCVLWHSLDHPSRDAWIERALEFEERLPDPGARIQFLALAHSAFIFSGETARSERVLNVLHGLVEALPSSPLANTVFRSVQGLDYWIRAEFESGISAVEEGLAAAEATGASVMVPLTLSVGGACAMSKGDQKLTKRYLAKMGEMADPRRRHDYAYIQIGRSWLASLGGNWPAAFHWGERAGITLEPLGVPVYSAMCDILQAVARHYMGDSEGGAVLLDRARKRAGAHGRWPLYGAAMAEAEIALGRGDMSSALQALSEALVMGRECGFWSYSGWRRDVLSRLCAEALVAGIEVPYTLSLIEKYRLLPPDTREVALDNWPWPVVVRSMGGFELLRGGHQVQFSSKVPTKPLQLLELLVIRGGRQVPEDWLADALWPDAEGDAAIDSLSTTILRLRRLLEAKGLLLRQNRCLTLDRQRCRVDAWALEDELRALPTLEDVPSIITATDRVMSLYRGSFMPQSSLPATLGYRDRLLRRTLDSLDAAVQRVEAAGESRRASTISEKVRNLRDQVIRLL